ncbi:MAG: hypothetical protein BWY74_02186 [Firmicutes bacterium ADurb.Bin419]|nr:MAG: hypothetical protein BWY74_02186 [Firmicutes bacterium ADurb.Bin419]
MIITPNSRKQISYVKRNLTLRINTLLSYLERFVPSGSYLIDPSRVRLHVYTSNNYYGIIPLAFSVPLKEKLTSSYAKALQGDMDAYLNTNNNLVVKIDTRESILKCYSNSLANRLMVFKGTQYEGVQEIDQKIASILTLRKEFNLWHFINKIEELHNMQDSPGIYMKLLNKMQNSTPDSISGCLRSILGNELIIDPMIPGTTRPFKLNINDPWVIESIKFAADNSDVIVDHTETAGIIKAEISEVQEVLSGCTDYDSVPFHDIPY